MTKRSIVLIGGGGHCKSCIDLVLSTGQFTIAGIVDVKEKKGTDLLGFPVIATDEDLDTLQKKYDCFIVTLGQIKSPDLRMKTFDRLEQVNAVVPVIVSPSAYVSPFASIGNGTMIFHRANINADVTIGKNCIINTGAIVEHEVRIGNTCHISTAAVLNGNINISNGVFIGSNATLRQGINVGEYAIVGAGSAVLKNVQANQLVAGNPAKIIRNK